MFYALLLLATPVDGSYVATVATTAHLVQNCEQSTDDQIASYCSGYIMAAFDVLSQARLICPVYGVSTKQVLAVAKKYLKDHPESWDTAPGYLLRTAFVQAFPCAKISN